MIEITMLLIMTMTMTMISDYSNKEAPSSVCVYALRVSLSFWALGFGFQGYNEFNGVKSLPRT